MSQGDRVNTTCTGERTKHIKQSRWPGCSLSKVTVLNNTAPCRIQSVAGRLFFVENDKEGKEEPPSKKKSNKYISLSNSVLCQAGGEGTLLQRGAEQGFQ